jgi:hypothetical protein
MEASYTSPSSQSSSAGGQPPHISGTVSWPYHSYLIFLPCTRQIMHKHHVGTVTFVSCCLVGVEYEVEKVYASEAQSGLNA